MKDNDNNEQMDNNGEKSPDSITNGTNDKMMDDIKETSPSNTSVNVVSKKKTAKTAPSKFRSTGNNNNNNNNNNNSGDIDKHVSVLRHQNIGFDGRLSGQS